MHPGLSSRALASGSFVIMAKCVVLAGASEILFCRLSSSPSWSLQALLLSKTPLLTELEEIPMANAKLGANSDATRTPTSQFSRVSSISPVPDVGQGSINSQIECHVDIWLRGEVLNISD